MYRPNCLSALAPPLDDFDAFAVEPVSSNSVADRSTCNARRPAASPSPFRRRINRIQAMAVASSSVWLTRALSRAFCSNCACRVSSHTWWASSFRTNSPRD